MRTENLWLLATIAAVASTIVVWLFFRRRAGRAGRPRAGEIWWADVPYTDGSGSKVRPCLVLLRRRRGVVVLKITSQDKSHRHDHVLIPTRSWDPWARHDSYLNLGEPIIVRLAAFQRHAGGCDPAILKQIARRPGLLRRDLAALATGVR
jgi:mRNA-degrading endonuclease toxin of MazEF toxin-antitoxin module